VPAHNPAVRYPLVVVLASLMCAVVLVGTAFAQGPDFLGGKVRTGEAVTIPSTETVSGDLYVFAGTLNVDGTVEGDLVAFGGQINVNGTVNGSILAAGGAMTLGGQTRGAARLAGGQVTVLGTVGKDLSIAGGQFSTTSAARVGQDVLFATGTTRLSGAIAGSVLGTTGEYSRDGTIGGTEEVDINTSSSTATPVPAAAEPVTDALRHLVTVLVVGGLLLFLRPRLMPAWDALMRARPAASLGYGVIALVGFIAAVIIGIIAIIVLAMIFGALSLGALVAIDVIGGMLLVGVGILAFVVICSIVVDAIVGYAVGRMIMQSPKLGRWQALTYLVVGAAIVVALASVPAIGGIIKLVVVLVGLGVITLWVLGHRAEVTPSTT
jgi:cytoskeletal protein CcmA (bactofilin family)